jgi:hypothetical protein
VSEPELPIGPIVGVRANDPTASTAVSEGFSAFARSIGRGLSARSVSELLRETGVSITPYTVARISEDPRSAGSSPRLRQIMERGIRGRWTRKKVAAMPTEAIEAQLAVFGVKHSRERFVMLASDRNSAWTISKAWLKDDSIKCPDREEDFLGLAACELWKRLMPDQPSMEMIDDWMQEGYGLVEQDKEREACDMWWKVWRTLLPRFTPEMRTMHAVKEVFSGYQSVFNWSQNFEMHLGNVARDNGHYAAIGRQYCTEWMAQFPDEGDGMQVNFRRALAWFLSQLGETAEMSAVLHRLPEEWPQDAWSYIALADAYSHFSSRECGLPLDVGKAIEYLEQGLAAIGRSGYDRDAIKDRLAELRMPSYAPAPQRG